MRTIVFLLEELSAAEMLKGLVPRIIQDNIIVRYIAFEGKNDLEKQLTKKLRGWQTPNTTFVIIRDKDGGDGPTIKQRLVGLCAASGKENYLIRIACHELESWYLGDLFSVDLALNLNTSPQQNNKKFRTPDNLANAAEELIKLTNHSYQKVAGSRAIGKVLRIDGNLSHSYNVFISGLQSI
ncbi:DUF4276 family protein [Yersinia ruckeri]|uniref:DUF4276 family protein n=1 Tax=Yersinia ruckeri TaxID=29486 RepID=UPI0008FDBB45|nr:DUF4276 family protein [Yersinia ruckeri]EKN4206973.1 DUF4276 family protein [Yersinia ruckeri]OJB82216.1 hypothetical protein A9Q60_10360 [Yersinia ruckeri]OJB82975.1 hypothetical protein A9Q62_10730 [Yersinia ruckeri]